MAKAHERSQSEIYRKVHRSLENSQLVHCLLRESFEAEERRGKDGKTGEGYPTASNLVKIGISFCLFRLIETVLENHQQPAYDASREKPRLKSIQGRTCCPKRATCNN